MRIVILTAQTGGAHGSLAAAIATRLDEEATAIKISDAGAADNSNIIPKAYSYLVTSLPAVWALYYYSRRLRTVRALNRSIIRWIIPPHVAIGEAEAEADLVIITHPLYCNYIDDLNSFACNVVVVPTDLFSGPAEWFTPNASLYVLASQQMRAHAVRAGVPPGRVIVRRLPTGLPIAATVKSAPRSARPHILVIGGAEGVGPIWEITSGLLKARCRPVLTVACGNNDRLAATMRSDFPGIRILQFFPDLARTFHEYDLIVTKPGSLTLQEAADAGVPFLLMPGVPGLETSTSRVCQRLGMPLVRDAYSARGLLDELIDHSGLPRAGWRNLINRYVRFREMLPAESLTFADLRTAR